ncbi:hypothetical protein AVEN_106553-1 [Araneus ventricosus]|uniref:Uncharacterized protein n=1 Tax=Araneus ventricosus TaxID=182803 RepID=A0A4Y2RKJ9_ARAVE|nr:hypothetical protein AVEN_106553-1 [Araneus ventricosus]
MSYCYLFNVFKAHGFSSEFTYRKPWASLFGVSANSPQTPVDWVEPCHQLSNRTIHAPPAHLGEITLPLPGQSRRLVVLRVAFLRDFSARCPISRGHPCLPPFDPRFFDKAVETVMISGN